MVNAHTRAVNNSCGYYRDLLVFSVRSGLIFISVENANHAAFCSRRSMISIHC